jgi:ABC-type nitrate/sulfonate/bicarbonate transport system permease component
MIDGLRSTDNSIEKVALTLGATKLQILRLIRIPSSIPYLFSGMKIGISVSVIGAVIGEWVGASSGLGYLMLQAAPRFQTTLVFASIVFLSIMGLSLFAFIQIIEYRFTKWNRFSSN